LVLRVKSLLFVNDFCGLVGSLWFSSSCTIDQDMGHRPFDVVRVLRQA
jgi:hypothetical protein